MTDADIETHPGFGALARRIAARGLATPATERAERVRIAFRHDRLDPSDRERLEVLCGSGASLEPLGARGECVLSATHTQLAAASTTSALVRALLYAHDCAAATPGPVRLMGVVNVTPDSFSDGGRFRDAARAVEHALALAAAGAQVLDVGGESTRPGAAPVELEEELARVIPVVSELARETQVPISIDTQKSDVARAALECGASIVNDVSAGRFDPRMLAVVAERRAGYVAMHMQGTPRDMQTSPFYGDPLSDVLEFLRERAASCLSAGIETSRLWIDPGIGFGKRLEHNLELLRRLSELRSLGLPVCLGVSRKAFIGRLSELRHAAPSSPRAADRSGRKGATPVDRSAGDRCAGTAAALTAGVLAGAEILRVHDVAAMHEAVAVAGALTAWSAHAPREP